MTAPPVTTVTPLAIATIPTASPALVAHSGHPICHPFSLEISSSSRSLSLDLIFPFYCSPLSFYSMPRVSLPLGAKYFMHWQSGAIVNSTYVNCHSIIFETLLVSIGHSTLKTQLNFTFAVRLFPLSHLPLGHKSLKWTKP